MSRYILIRRLRGPALLLLVGVLALLQQFGVIYHFWHLFWPLLLIMLGVFLLAERAALASEGDFPPSYPGSYPGAPYQYPGQYGAPYPGGVNPAGAPQYPAQPGTAIVPTHHDFEKDPNGGQS